jgi:hypothetical protein
MKQKEFKVGDKVISIKLGECVVASISDDKNYPIIVTSKKGRCDCYSVTGKSNLSDEYESLFHPESNPFKKPDFEPRWMMVSSDGERWNKRFVFMVKNSNFYAWIDAETDEQVLIKTSIHIWNYAKEIEEPKSTEFTMQEIADKLGVPVKQLKIKK